MSNNTHGEYAEIFERARALAEVGSAPLSSGHLLLAILTGSGTAERTLALRGLTETRVRGALRELDPEPASVCPDVERRAQQVAATFGAREASSLHLLAALAAARDGHAHRILRDAGLDTDVIRNQALRCLTTGFTRERGGPKDAARRAAPFAASGKDHSRGAARPAEQV